MSENPLGNDSKLKLKLKNTDTNRFKVATGRMPKLSTPEETTAAPEEAASQGATQQDIAVNKASVTQPISDPLSLRDTATGKLKRISDSQEAASALAPQPISTPAGAPQGAKTETVRLKVVRSASRPTVNLTETGPQAAPPPRPTISLTPAAAPQGAEAPAAAAPAKPETPTAPAAAIAEEDSVDGKPVTATATKISSSTIKLNIRKPGAPPAAGTSPGQTVQVAPPDEAAAATAAPPPVPGTSSTLKIRPADGSAPAPAAAADSSAGATVKIKAPPPSTAGGDKKKITLRKDLPPVTTPEPVPPPVAVAGESTAPESAQTVAVPAPPADQKKGGLKIRTGGEAAAVTQAAVPPPSATGSAARKSQTVPTPAESAFPAAATGTVSALELVTISVAAIAVIVSIVRFALDMVQQIQ